MEDLLALADDGAVAGEGGLFEHGGEVGDLFVVHTDTALLDEPAAGMNPSETAELMEHIRLIRGTFQIAIMLIEHDMNLVMGVCEGIAVVNYGKIIAKGTPDQIRSNPEVIEAYLGKKGAADAESR